MNKTMKELFGPIRAEEALKDRTMAFLAQKTQNDAESAEHPHRRPLYAMACTCVLLAVLLGGYWLYFIPTAKISMDINPSIELSVNRLDRVISVDGLNEDGRALSRSLDVKYMHYADAVEEILNCDSVTALLSGDEVMDITVIGSDGGQSAQILSDVERCTAHQSKIDCHSAQPEEVAEAHEEGLSCGKYRAFLELQRLDPDITPEAVQDMTMREIREMIARLTANGEVEPSSSSSPGNEHHGEDHGNGRRHGRTEHSGNEE